MPSARSSLGDLVEFRRLPALHQQHPLAPGSQQPGGTNARSAHADDHTERVSPSVIPFLGVLINFPEL